MSKYPILFSIAAAICSCAPQSSIVQGQQRQDSGQSYDDALANEGLADCNGTILDLNEDHEACPPNGGFQPVSNDPGNTNNNSSGNENIAANDPVAANPNPNDPVVPPSNQPVNNPNDPVVNPNDQAANPNPNDPAANPNPNDQAAANPVPTPAPTPALDPAANGDPNVVVFRIKAGTGNGAWNTAETMITAKVGQVIRFVNDDTVRHRLHTGGEPCNHGPNFEPGATWDCVASDPVVSEAGAIRTYDHNSGRNNAPVFMKVDP